MRKYVRTLLLGSWISVCCMNDQGNVDLVHELHLAELATANTRAQTGDFSLKDGWEGTDLIQRYKIVTRLIRNQPKADTFSPQQAETENEPQPGATRRRSPLQPYHYNLTGFHCVPCSRDPLCILNCCLACYFCCRWWKENCPK